MTVLMNNNTMKHYVSRHETVLHDLLDAADIPAQRIKEAIRYSLFPGGKRLRPVLVYLCGEIIGVNLLVLDRIAAAIELMHCYSLVHDDLPSMDNDDMRRGKPSCHRAFDEATAILVGDGMQAFALDILLSQSPQVLSSSKVIKITHELIKACGISGMVSGQSLDLSELANRNINEAQLRKIHMLKTGQLIMACINMVLAAGDPSLSVSIALREFAKQLGLVFQMQDDYLDQYGETDPLGKGRASDSENQKTTFATLYGQEELYALIVQHFQYAENALAPFEASADNLRLLIRNLQHRR